MHASYKTLWRYVHQELSWREKPSSVRIDDPPPGQEAQVDFGKMGLQTTEVVCEGLDRAWMFFGGIVATMIPDNTKAMINDPDPLEPTLVAAWRRSSTTSRRAV